MVALVTVVLSNGDLLWNYEILENNVKVTFINRRFKVIRYNYSKQISLNFDANMIVLMQ